jgi:hypothetical protein
MTTMSTGMSTPFGNAASGAAGSNIVEAELYGGHCRTRTCDLVRVKHSSAALQRLAGVTAICYEVPYLEMLLQLAVDCNAASRNSQGLRGGTKLAQSSGNRNGGLLAQVRRAGTSSPEHRQQLIRKRVVGRHPDSDRE